MPCSPACIYAVGGESLVGWDSEVGSRVAHLAPTLGAGDYCTRDSWIAAQQGGSRFHIAYHYRLSDSGAANRLAIHLNQGGDAYSVTRRFAQLRQYICVSGASMAQGETFSFP